MKNILAISFSFPPDTGSGSLRNLKILKYLPENGWRLRVLTHRASKEDMERGRTLLEEVPEECEVIRTNYVDTPRLFGALRRFVRPFRKTKKNSANGSITPTEPAQHHASAGSDERRGLLNRIKDFVTLSFSIPDRVAGWLPFAVWAGARAMRREKVDVIYAVGKPWTAFLVGYLLKLMFRKPLVIDFMDPWGACTWSWSKPHIFEWLDRRLERFIVKRSDFIVANTDTLRADFIDRLNVPPERVGVVTCGYDDNDFQNLSKANATCGVLRSEETNGQLFTVTHTGSFYKRRNPVYFLKAAKKLIDSGAIPADRLRINFVGSNSVRDPELHSLLAGPMFSEIVHQEAWVPHERVLDYLYSSHLLLLVQPDTMLQIPAKLYEYVATRRPVLALSDENGAVDQIISREGWGEVVSNDNIDGIANSLLQSYQQYEQGKAQLLESKGVNQYSTRSLARRLSGMLESTLPSVTIPSRQQKVMS